MSTGTSAAWIKPSFDGRRSSDNSGLSLRCRSPTIGTVQSFWHSSGHDLVASKIQVAADYSDSAADSSNYVANGSYHPFEELKHHGKVRDVLLTDAEIARTTVELPALTQLRLSFQTNSKALLVFPGRVHCEPHGHISWAEFHYVIDDYGDMFFELFDDENILKEHNSTNPVIVLIGMDIPVNGESRLESGNFFDYMDNDGISNAMLDDDYKEIVDTEITNTLIKWGMPETLRGIHPIYFAKSLAKSVHSKHREKMDYPTNGLSIIGCLRPAFVDEESYLRGLFHKEYDDDYGFDWRDESEKEEEQMAEMHGLIDGELNFSSRQDRSSIKSTLYKLEIMALELFSVYGDQSIINLQDFQDAEPDVLAHCASAIIDRFSEDGMRCDDALKTLCRKRKGLVVEGANLIGVDSLGMDIRVFSGLEAKTLRISFNARAMTESSAEKKIRRMLFPHYHRKKSRSPSIGVET